MIWFAAVIVAWSLLFALRRGKHRHNYLETGGVALGVWRGKKNAAGKVVRLRGLAGVCDSPWCWARAIWNADLRRWEECE